MKWAAITIILIILGFVYPTVMLGYHKEVNGYIAAVWLFCFITSFAKWGHYDSLETQNAFVRNNQGKEQSTIRSIMQKDDGLL